MRKGGGGGGGGGPETESGDFLFATGEVASSLRGVRDDVPGEHGDDDGGKTFYQEKETPGADGRDFA